MDGVLLDLGVSSHQLDRPERGFRFSPGPESPLDMRMDRDGDGITAARLLASLSAEELERVFSKYGELPGARRLARAIVEHRELGPLATAKDLIDLIQGAGIGRGRSTTPRRSSSRPCASPSTTSSPPSKRASPQRSASCAPAAGSSS